jgi:hypothetical protein
LRSGCICKRRWCGRGNVLQFHNTSV